MCKMIYFYFFAVMQQSATEKERGRSGQFNKRKYILNMTVSYISEINEIAKHIFT